MQHLSSGTRWQHLGRFLKWLALGAVGLALLSFLAAHAPPRVKLLGLFAVGYGFLAGWGLSRLADLVDLSNRRVLISASLALILAGQLGLVWESHRLYEVRERKRLETTAQPLFPQLLQQTAKLESGEDLDNLRTAEALASSLQQERQRVLAERTRFQNYLKHRVSALGDWPPPWPLVFWCVETFLGTFVGVGVIHRMAPPGREPAETDSEVQEDEQPHLSRPENP